MIICAPGGERSSPSFRFKFCSSGHFGTQMSASGAPSNPAVQYQILSTRLSLTRRHHARVSAMLSKFERYPLTFGPTPIEKLSRLTAHLGGGGRQDRDEMPPDPGKLGTARGCGLRPGGEHHAIPHHGRRDPAGGRGLS